MSPKGTNIMDYVYELQNKLLIAREQEKWSIPLDRGEYFKLRLKWMVIGSSIGGMVGVFIYRLVI